MLVRARSAALQTFASDIGALLPGWFRAAWLGEPLTQKLRITSVHNGIRRTRSGIQVGESVIAGKSHQTRKTKLRTVVDAYLPDEFFLEREIVAPKAAKSDLKSVARLDLLRRTPFDEDEVFWGLSRPTILGEQVLAKQWIVKADQIEDLWNQAQLHGFLIRRVFVDSQAALHPVADFSDKALPLRRFWRWINAILLTISIAFGFTAWLWPAFLADHELAKIEIEISKEREKAITLRSSVEGLRQRKAERAAFVQTVFFGPRLSEDILSLTGIMPDTVWLESAIFTPDSIHVTGESKSSVPNIVLNASGSDAFDNATLNGSVQRTSGGSERFQMILEPRRHK